MGATKGTFLFSRYSFLFIHDGSFSFLVMWNNITHWQPSSDIFILRTSSRYPESRKLFCHTRAFVQRRNCHEMHCTIEEESIFSSVLLNSFGFISKTIQKKRETSITKEIQLQHNSILKMLKLPPPSLLHSELQTSVSCIIKKKKILQQKKMLAAMLMKREKTYSIFRYKQIPPSQE